ncbi:MAG: hypothetical protein WC455_16385 [Dehalococcoidia bacterium]|jgi:hypothetical protein
MKSEIFKDKDKLKLAIDGFFDDTLDVSRSIIEQIIWRNMLYYLGEQYIEYVKSSNSFRRRLTPEFVPTPVSNEIREYVRSVKAMLMNQKMIPRVWPNTNEKEDNQAAELGQNLLVSLDNADDAEFLDEKEETCIWMCLSGTAFMRTYPDSDGGILLPGGGKTGSVACESVNPFNVRMDILGKRLRKKRWIGIKSLKDREWVEDTFKVKIQGGNGNEEPTNINYERRLAKLVGSVSPWKGQGIDYQSLEPDEDLVLFKEVEFRPTKEKPDGFYVVSCGGNTIHTADRLPIKSSSEEWNYSLTDFHFNYVPGRFWSDPGVNDLISPQNIINEIDQALAINRKGVGRPKILTPGDVGLKRIGLGGEGFLAMSYNPIMGQKPDFREGTPLPQQVLEERSLQKQQMQDASGDPKNVLRGQQPSANASGILTEGLRETAERGRYPDLDRFNRSLTRVYKKRLLVAQEVMTEERLVKSMGRGNKVKISKFKAADLRGNTDVRLELDSGLIATKSGQAQMMLNMIQAGFFKEGDISPTVRQEILQRMGMTGFSEETNNDVERAEKENVAVASGELPVMLAEKDPETGEDIVLNLDPLFKYDNHKSHFEAHRKYLISPEFAELPERYQTVLIAHTDLHQKMIRDQRPDVREYVQIDKLLPSLKESERSQALDSIGIKAGNEPEIGLPDANTITKTRERILTSDKKLAHSEEQMHADMLKHGMTEGVKIHALQAQAIQGRDKGGDSKPSPGSK